MRALVAQLASPGTPQLLCVAPAAEFKLWPARAHSPGISYAAGVPVSCLLGGSQTYVTLFSS